MTTQPILRLQHIVKKFANHLAVDNVSFELYRGEILALLGENGAGKSTLIKILAGLYSQDKGEISFPQQTSHLSASPPIAFIHQDLGLIEWMTVAENIALVMGFPRHFGLIHWKKVREQAQQTLDFVGVHLDPDTRVFNLNRTEKALVAIARALARNAEILVLDEPTASLPANDVSHLFSVLDSLREKGIGMIYVTHRLDEVMQLSDHIVVMRDGKLVTQGKTQDYDIPTLISAIAGEQNEEHQPLAPLQSPRPLLELKNVIVGNVGPVSFHLHQGEMLALAGLRGAGQEEIGRLLFGMGALAQGEMFLDNRPYEAKSPKQAIKSGIALLAGERLKESLVSSMSTTENLFINPCLSGHSALAPYSLKQEQEKAWTQFELFDIRPKNLQINIESLSGGNQQKVVLARWLQLQMPILILEDPTAGVDVGARKEIYKLLNQALQRGCAILIISNDFEEIAHCCHRALVFNRGEIAGELVKEQVTFANLLSLASTENNN